MDTKAKVNFNITGLLLCAGLSGRMGKSKALIIYNGLPFAVIIIKKLLQVCNEVIVVVGYESEKVEEVIKNYIKTNEGSKVKFTFNENYKSGMFTSLQCGLRNISLTDWILYHFVDQPTIPKTFYSDFTNRLSSDFNWLQPSFLGKLGHPILFGKNISDYILGLNQQNSLRDLKNDKRIKKHIWQCKYPEVLQDIDTLEQYNNLAI
jgi:molybdenum cofactor cytidylyltransferase